MDTNTGKPVSKVFVQAYWHFSVPNPMDSTGDENVYGTVTDEEGRFSIPSKNVTRTFSQFVDLNLHVVHPLYDFQRVQIYVDGTYKRGSALRDRLDLVLPVDALEDKYTEFEDRFRLASVIDDSGPEFYVAMKKLYGIRYDVREIMSTLERPSRRFPEPDADLCNTEAAYKRLLNGPWSQMSSSPSFNGRDPPPPRIGRGTRQPSRSPLQNHGECD